MKLYKSENDEIFAYELDGSQDHFIGNKIAITEEEANLILETQHQKRIAMLPTKDEQIAKLQAQIDALKA